MKYIVSFGTFVGISVCLLALPAVTQAPTPVPSVWLQPASPGTAQTGNIRVSGKYMGAVSQNGGAAMELEFTGTVGKGLLVTAAGSNSIGVLSTAATGVKGQGVFAGVFGETSSPRGMACTALLTTARVLLFMASSSALEMVLGHGQRAV